MQDIIPINLPAIEAKQAQRIAKEIQAQQVASEARFTEDVEESGFNPQAAAALQERLNRFRALDRRERLLEAKGEQKILEVTEKGEEDLAHEFQRRNPELPAARLARLRQALRPNSTEQEILDEVSSVFSDPTLADEALDYLDKSTTGDLQARVRRARVLLNDEKRREIVAGRNISPVARSFSEKGLGESPTALRDLYRDMTAQERDHNALFKELSDRFPFDDLKMAVAFLLQGCAYDLKSKGPSIQEAELMFLMTEVRTLQSILWVYLFFKYRMKLIRSLFKKNGLTLSRTLNFEKLAKEFIKLVEERYPTILKLIKQMEDLGLIDPAKVIILSQFRDAIRQLSPRVYKNPRHQQDLLVVILEALEQLEEEEEEQ